MIRGKQNKCPFGLDIPSGCQLSGTLDNDGNSIISTMTMISDSMSEEEMAEAISENKNMLADIAMLSDDPKKCPFADVILVKKNAVDCKFDENIEHIPAGNTGVGGSPAYPHIMVGQSAKTQYGSGEPLEYMNNYTDDNNTNIYYGIYNLIG
jgi:hypothetical protein